MAAWCTPRETSLRQFVCDWNIQLSCGIQGEDLRSQQGQLIKEYGATLSVMLLSKEASVLFRKLNQGIVQRMEWVGQEHDKLTLGIRLHCSGGEHQNNSDLRKQSSSPSGCTAKQGNDVRIMWNAVCSHTIFPRQEQLRCKEEMKKPSAYLMHRQDPFLYSFNKI